jgi:type II secretory pathway pseudopilin PulG
VTRARYPSRGRAAFTLIEAIVVVVIISVMAGVIVPRMVARDRSGVKREIEAVRSLLSAAAQRDVMTSQLVALHFDADTSTLSVLTLADEDEKKPRGDDLWPWRVDRLIPSVVLTKTSVVRSQADEVALDEDEWLIELVRGVRRPDLLLELKGDRDQLWSVYLPSKGAAAAAWRGDTDEIERVSYDLDAQGKESREW